MIEVIAGNNEVEIEGKKFHSFSSPDTLAAMIVYLLDKAYYSGESMRVYKEIEGGKMKELVDEY